MSQNEQAGKKMPRNKKQKAAAKKLLKMNPGDFEVVDLKTAANVPDHMTRAFTNNRYVVMVFDDARMKMPCLDGAIGAVKVMVQRHDDKPIPNHWREMQDIKNTLFGSNAIGIEFYPIEADLVDKANIYWMWLVDTNYLPQPFRNHL